MNTYELEKLFGTVGRARHQLDLAKFRLAELENEKRETKAELERLERIRKVVQGVSVQIQYEISEKITSLVNEALQELFGDEYEFAIRFEAQRGKVYAFLTLKRDGEEVSIADSVGGGVVDIIALTLRLSFWALRGDTPPVLIFDEPLRFLSEGYRAVAAQLLRKIAEMLDVQIIMVTHTPEFANAAERVFVVKKENGQSKVGVQ